MNFVQVNDAACEKLGYTREELLNSSPQDIDAAYSSGRMPELIEKLHENKQVLFETEMLSKNGHRIPMEVSVNLFQLDDNQATMCVARDITDRKQVEQELANRLIFQQTLIDTIPHPIFFKNEVGRFVGCNRAYEREFGITRDYMIGKTVLDLNYLPIDERQRFQDEDIMVIREAGRKSYEMPIVYADGQTHITLYSVDGFALADGNPGGLIGMLVDITERKQAEDELAKYRERLEHLVEERTQELENKTKTLEEVNIALKVLLQHREEDKKDLEDRFVMNIKNLIIPFAEKMKNTNLDERQLAYLGIIETHLRDITSSMIKKFNHFNLTPAEVEVASLIKEGKATKEIAKIIGIATSSIDTHRNNIRKKLGISQKAVNLRSHLQSFN
jgi:PAS domain S-box-containing protein